MPAQMLGRLGQSQLAAGMSDIARVANVGGLPVSPELEDELRAARAAIQDMHRQLVTALGVKSQDRPWHSSAASTALRGLAAARICRAGSGPGPSAWMGCPRAHLRRFGGSSRRRRLGQTRLAAAAIALPASANAVCHMAPPLLAAWLEPVAASAAYDADPSTGIDGPIWARIMELEYFVESAGPGDAIGPAVHARYLAYQMDVEMCADRRIDFADRIGDELAKPSSLDIPRLWL